MARGLAGLRTAQQRPAAVAVNPASRSGDGGAATAGHDLRCCPGPQVLGILAHDHVADVVERPDVPVAADGGDDNLGRPARVRGRGW